jgi:hypothetical protein
MSSLTEVSSTSRSSEAFTAKGPVFLQSGEGLCSKAAMWYTSTFNCGVPEVFLRELYAGHFALHRGSCGEDSAFPPPLEMLALQL